jgi:hypothetical protein
LIIVSIPFNDFVVDTNYSSSLSIETEILGDRKMVATSKSVN